MTELPVRITGRHGGSRTATIHTTPPSGWSAEDALAFLHEVMRLLDAHGIYRVSVEAVVPFRTWTLTVEADAGTATTGALELSAEAAMELERRAFRIPGSRNVQ